MADDELSAPLGQNTKKKRRRFKLPIRVPHVIAGGLGLFVLRLRGLGAGGRRSARRRADRGGGDRLRSAEIAGQPRSWRAAPRKARAATTARARPRRSRCRSRRRPSRRSRRSRAAARRPTPRPSPSSTARPASARRSRSRRRATSARRSSSACWRPRATAPSRGSRPTARGRPKSTPAPSKPLQGRKDGPRIAIVIGGLGVSANVTQQAMRQTARRR